MEYLTSTNEGLVFEWEHNGCLVRTVFNGRNVKTVIYGTVNKELDDWYTMEEIKAIIAKEQNSENNM